MRWSTCLLIGVWSRNPLWSSVSCTAQVSRDLDDSVTQLGEVKDDWSRPTLSSSVALKLTGCLRCRSSRMSESSSSHSFSSSEIQHSTQTVGLQYMICNANCLPCLFFSRIKIKLNYDIFEGLNFEILSQLRCWNYRLLIRWWMTWWNDYKSLLRDWANLWRGIAASLHTEHLTASEDIPY